MVDEKCISASSAILNGGVLFDIDKAVLTDSFLLANEEALMLSPLCL